MRTNGETFDYSKIIKQLHFRLQDRENDWTTIVKNLKRVARIKERRDREYRRTKNVD